MIADPMPGGWFEGLGRSRQGRILRQAPAGRVAAIDLENVAEGPPEWDRPWAVLYFDCGWYSAEQHAVGVRVYGSTSGSCRRWSRDGPAA